MDLNRGAPLCAFFLLALVVACGEGDIAEGPTATPAASAAGALTVRAFEWGFEPAAISLRRGEQVRIVLKNEGRILHNWKVDGLEAQVSESRSTGPLSGEEGELFVGADDGQEGTLVFTPQEAGAFTFYCTFEDHRQLGMEGTLFVQ